MLHFLLNRLAELTPVELLAIALHVPAFSLVIAGVIVGVAAIVRRARGVRRDTAGDDLVAGLATRETTMLAIGALVVIVVVIAEGIVPGYLVSLVDVVEWWRYATPPAIAAVILGVVAAVIVVRGSARPDEPVAPTERRSWFSFGPRGGLIAASVAGLALIATTIGAGLASSADDRGRYIYLELNAPNTTLDAVRPWFYGWSFGVPVLVAVALLIASAWAVLHVNAVRPFRRPATVATEQRIRRAIASRAVAIAAGAILLSLAGAFRFIDRAAGAGTLHIQGDPATYDITWRYAEFAAISGALAPLLEVVAFVLMLRVIGGRLKRSSDESLAVHEPERVAS